MAKKILIKRSSVAGKVPTTSDLEIGELAVNLADKKLYTKRLNPDTGEEEIVSVGGGGSGSVTYKDGTFTGDGSTTDFEVSGGYPANQIEVFLNGINVTTEVDVSDGQYVKFNEAPNDGDEIYYYFYQLEAGGGSGIEKVLVDSDTNVEKDKLYIVNTSTNEITLTLPASPADGDLLWIADGRNNAQNHPATVNRNGKKINENEEDLICDVNSFYIALVFNSSADSWYVINAEAQ